MIFFCFVFVWLDVIGVTENNLSEILYLGKGDVLVPLLPQCNCLLWHALFGVNKG